MKDSFSVATILPFWRYAVVPESNGIPGIPFYSIASALEFFKEARQLIPWDGVYLIKRVWGGVEVVRYYRGAREEE